MLSPQPAKVATTCEQRPYRRSVHIHNNSSITVEGLQFNARLSFTEMADRRQCNGFG